MLSERAQRQVDRLLDEADEAIRERDWRRVLACAQDVLALNPENPDAQTYASAAERALRTSSDSPEGAKPVLSPADLAEAEPPRRPSPAPSLPESFCDGRYRVERFLGEGGKKRVYLAHDTKLDRDVAFALIKTDGLDAEGQARIRREAQAMGRLGDHPHVVPV